VEPHCKRKGQEKIEDCGGDDGRGEPEVGAESVRAGEQKKEGGVHENIPEENKKNMMRKLERQGYDGVQTLAKSRSARRVLERHR
jgi:hypothetical protein